MGSVAGYARVLHRELDQTIGYGALATGRTVMRCFVLITLALTLAGCSSSSDKVTPPSPPSPEAIAAIAVSADPKLPGLTGDPALMTLLEQAFQAMKKGYVARTHHKNDAGVPKYINRLVFENSPYLLQHAHNPVNWRPWGKAAFDRAKALNRPVLLSVGYSTCHWCHVMERESFEDEEIARYINENFVAIKVDREERPDVDDIYMKAVNLLAGRGGWPMTVVMTPDREPFFGGTYFPARDGDRGSRKGFLTILGELEKRYRENPAEAVRQAKQVSERIRAISQPGRPGTVPGPEALQRAAQGFAARFDARWGGFGQRPKFPRPVTLDFLLRYHRRTQDAHALHMVAHTLRKMAAGGMYDHLGGGFHRYSVDSRWLVPHFEKMLYDNGQLTATFLDAFQLTQEPLFSRVAQEVLDYVAREMTAAGGAFFSATDADSSTPSGHSEEGWFFTWTPAEIETLLGAEGLALFKATYAVTDRGNFEGRNILHTPVSYAQVAARQGMSEETLRRKLAPYRKTLYDARAKRPAPILDDKILTSWNGLMISAFARGGRILDVPTYTQRAERAADFILTQMVDRKGRLYRTHRDGRSKILGYLDDYAFFIAALLDLYEATGALRWYEAAVTLQAQQDAHFLDADSGGYFTTSGDHEVLLAREKPDYDGAEPSGNSVTAMNLLRLYAFNSQDTYRRRADGVFSAFARSLGRGSISQPALLSALDMRLDKPIQVVLVHPEGVDGKAMSDVVRKHYLPNRAIATVSSASAARQQQAIPLLKAKTAQGGRTTAYVCEEGRCERPTSDPTVFAQQLAKVQPLFETHSAPPLSP